MFTVEPALFVAVAVTFVPSLVKLMFVTEETVFPESVWIVTSFTVALAFTVTSPRVIVGTLFVFVATIT